GRARRARTDEPDAIESAGRTRRGRTDETGSIEPVGRARLGRTDEPGVDVPAARGRTDERAPSAPARDWRDEAGGTRGGRRGGDSGQVDPAARGWRDEAASADVPTQRRRGRNDEPDVPGRRSRGEEPDLPGRRSRDDDPGDQSGRGRGGRRSAPEAPGPPGQGGDRGTWAGEPDSDRWRHPDMTGEWSRRAMAPIEPGPDRGDDRRGPGPDDRPDRDGAPRGRRAATGDGGADTGSWRTDERGRRGDSGHRPGSTRDDAHDTGSWERMTDTGQYDSTTSTGEWDRLVGSIEDEEAEEKFEAFWSGHRLAGDDPRWVETPATAPRSPAVGLPEPRRPEPDDYDDGDGPRRGRPGADAGRPDTLARAAMPPVDATDPGWGAPARSTARRESAPARSAPAPQRQQYPPQRRSMGWQQEEFEQLDPDNGGFMAAVLYAAAWYAVPVLAFGIWLMTLPAVAIDDCVSDITGGGCESPRAQALEGLLSGVPQFGIALGISLIAAVLLRWLGHSWRAGSVGLAAAVVGGGLATVFNSIFTGQPLG
ncbi:hypothetical protein, partial [Asanoa ishikariensis]